MTTERNLIMAGGVILLFSHAIVPKMRYYGNHGKWVNIVIDAYLNVQNSLKSLIF